MVKDSAGMEYICTLDSVCSLDECNEVICTLDTTRKMPTTLEELSVAERSSCRNAISVIGA